MILSFTTFRKPGAHSYGPVPASDEETRLGSPETHARTSSKHFSFGPSFWLTILAALSTAFTIRNLLVIQLSSQPHVNYLEASVGSPYIGLARLARNESSPLWPLSSTHYPDFVAATEGSHIHHALTNGSVVRLDSERTVILQHRVRDYGLEHCTVKVEFLPRAHGRPAARAYGYIGESPYFTLWHLEDPECGAVLTSSALPTLLPSRKAFLGNITLDGTRQVQSSTFDCSAGSIQTLEIALACVSEPCVMEFRLTRSPRRQGFWVFQSEQA